MDRAAEQIEVEKNIEESLDANQSAAEERRTRVRLINRLAIMLDKADPDYISNNDLRRLNTEEDFFLASRIMRRTTPIPDGGAVYNLSDAFRPDHPHIEVLIGYADPRTWKKMTTDEQVLVKGHLDQCELCTAQVRYFRVNCDRMQVVPGEAPTRPQGAAIGDLDGLHSGPVSLNKASIGWIPQRDDV